MSRLEISSTGPSIRPASRSSTPSAIGTSGRAPATEATLSDSWMPDYDVPSQGQRAPTPDADSRTGRRCCELRPNIVDSLEYEPFRSPLNDASKQDSLDRIFAAYERRHSHLECIRFVNSSQRMELYHRLDNLERHLDRLHSSVEPLVAQPATIASTHSKASQKKLSARHANINLDLEALKGQVNAFNMFTEELRYHDRRQEDAEKSFNHAVRVISARLYVNKPFPRDEEVLVVCAPTLASRSGGPNDISLPIEPELEDY